MTMKKLKLMRKYRLGVHGSLREEDDDEMMDGPPIKSRHKSLMPMNPAILPGLILSPTPKSVTKTEEKHAVGKFETHDSKWKATIDGEVEKFMYPSLRLETLYSDGMIPDLVDDSDDNSMPSPKTIDEVLASTSKVNWELERVVPSPVTNAVQADSKRLEFDQKLHDAEAILRKREAASMRVSTAPLSLEAAASKASCLDGIGSKPTKTQAASSLYHNATKPIQQPIPRLPQARKLIKEIQRHTTNAGQIEYYADKQHLFTKWKKVGNSQHHQLSPLPPTTVQHESSDEEEEDDSDLEPEADDGSNQPFGKLSPRSLFYDECVKNQILPEPIFSRINEVTAPAFHLQTARHSSLADVTSMLMSSIQRNKHPKRGKRRHLALQLQQFGLGDSKIIALSKSLREFQAIQVLDLSDNRLTDVSIIPLLQSLATAGPTASDVHNSDNRSPQAKLLAASQTISNSGCILTVLNLSKNELGQKGCQQVARFWLPRVNLSHNSIGERGGTLLGAMLTNPACTMLSLDVSWNNIRRSGAVALGIAMRTNTSLRTLYMSMNRCGDGGGEQLAAALACNTTLTELDLSHNALTGASAVTFGFFLRQNQSLRTLSRRSRGSCSSESHSSRLRCEISLSVHDLETSTTGSTASSPIFDGSLPSASSPFELKMGESPYAFAVASELIEAALYQGRCVLSDLSYETDAFLDRPGLGELERKRPRRAVDQERRCLYSFQDPSKTPWKLPARGTLRATATFMAHRCLEARVLAGRESCLGLIQIVKRGFSSRDMMSLLDLVLADLQLTTTQAAFFVSHLQSSLPKMELLGRLWTCLIDGENAFAFLQQHLTQPEQWRLIDRFGPVMMQFSTANPTGHWTLTLRDARHRKLALWFASLNAHHTAIVARYHPKLTDCSQYGRGFHWRNVVFNQKRIQLTYSFFDACHVTECSKYQDGSELDQTVIQSAQVAMTDEELAALLAQVGAEVCAVYVPVHKRQNLKYHLVLFHLAIAARRVMARQAHHVLQHFPKNYESGRLRALVAMHHAIVDLECFGELLDRLALTDRPRVYTNLGYLNTVMPLAIDMDFEVDFTREDEKMLLRALVDLSISCPMDMIRIDSTRSTVLIIYSMYQTNTVPASGRICFRYVTHQATNRVEWLRARQQIYRHFLCGDRLKNLNDSNALALAASASNDSNSAATGTSPTDTNATTTPAPRNVNVDDLDVLERLIGLVHAGAFDAGNSILAMLHTAENRVFVVQPRSWNSCEEKLRAVGPRASVGHRQCERPIVSQAAMEFVLELSAPNGLTARAIAQRITRLYHEVLDHTVENEIVVSSHCEHEYRSSRLSWDTPCRTASV
ncbi:Leucine-rich repeat domain, L domain-like [Phytophthora cactorum]|nr:Leucine-rich repeat domain, L domain-like [Phytophthora cactorum]